MIVRSKETTSEDPTVPTKPGWEGMHCWWLLDKASAGTTGVVLCLSEFGPGIAHGLHRHSNARETLYIERGSGLVMTRERLQRVYPGDAITIEPNEWHGFINDRAETVRMVAFYDKDDYTDLEYEEIDNWRGEFEQLLAAQPGI